MAANLETQCLELSSKYRNSQLELDIVRGCLEVSVSIGVTFPLCSAYKYVHVMTTTTADCSLCQNVKKECDHWKDLSQSAERYRAERDSFRSQIEGLEQAFRKSKAKLRNDHRKEVSDLQATIASLNAEGE